MTHSALGPGPVPEPSQPWTDHQCFIINATCITPCHVTHFCCAHPHMSTCASWYTQPSGLCSFSLAVMTHSTLGPEPVPAPTQPQTDPQHFIVNMTRIVSHHMTHSRCMPLHTHTSTSWYAQPPSGPCGFLLSLQTANLYKKPF